MRKIIFFGGSFDPPHLGHLALARSALQEVQADEIWITPTGNASRYKSRALSAPQHRLAMCQLAFGGLPRSRLCSAEIFSLQPHYTLATLESLEQQSSEAMDWFLLLGADQFAQIHTWQRWQALVEKVTFVLAPRNDQVPEEGYPPFPPNARIVRLQSRIPAISSTTVRRSLCAPQIFLPPAHTLLQPQVLRYIAEHSIYPFSSLHGHQ